MAWSNNTDDILKNIVFKDNFYVCFKWHTLRYSLGDKSLPVPMVTEFYDALYKASTLRMNYVTTMEIIIFSAACNEPRESQHGQVITSVIKCGMTLFSRTSTMQPLKFDNG